MLYDVLLHSSAVLGNVTDELYCKVCSIPESADFLLSMQGEWLQKLLQLDLSGGEDVSYALDIRHSAVQVSAPKLAA